LASGLPFLAVTKRIGAGIVGGSALGERKWIQDGYPAKTGVLPTLRLVVPVPGPSVRSPGVAKFSPGPTASGHCPAMRDRGRVLGSWRDDVALGEELAREVILAKLPRWGSSNWRAGSLFIGGDETSAAGRRAGCESLLR
jgi:hypothetical protein